MPHIAIDLLNWTTERLSQATILLLAGSVVGPLAAGVGIVAFIGIGDAPSVHAQSPTTGSGGAHASSERSEPTFDVVSVKAAGPVCVSLSPDRTLCGGKSNFEYSGDRLKFTLQLDEIIKHAYSLKDWEFIAPNWLSEQLYSVQAILPAGSSRDDGRLMVLLQIEGGVADDGVRAR
jgi:hypothetical protein